MLPAIRTVFILALVASGCARAPSNYIAPRALHVDPASYQESRLIAYRTLVRADFMAPQAPSGMDAGNVAAVTAALIRTSPVTISTRPYRSDGETLFLATVQNVRFEARMSQNHSWWNPRHTATERQLLEHEQVHFAFSELAARRANAEIEAIRQRTRSFAKTPDDAIRLASDRLQQEVDRLQEEVNARNEAFDRETVNGRLSECNHEWFERIQLELERSGSDDLAAASVKRFQP